MLLLASPYLYRYDVQHSTNLALFWPAKRGELNTVVRLLDQGGNIHFSARQRKLGVLTSLHIVSRHRHHRIASILIFEWRKHSTTSLRWSYTTWIGSCGQIRCSSGHLGQARCRYSQHFPAPWGGSTALHFATYTGATSIVKLLLGNGADTKALDLKKPNTIALGYRIRHSRKLHVRNDLPTVRLQAGAKGPRKETETVSLLLDHDANTEVEDEFGHSPREDAKSNLNRI